MSKDKTPSNDERIDQLIFHFPSEDGQNRESLILNLHPVDNACRDIKIHYPSMNHVDWEKYISNKANKHYIYDLVQKITYSVQDLNNDYLDAKTLTVKDIIYRISLVCWISNAMYLLRKCIEPKHLRGFRFNKENQLEKAYKYLRALRSFSVAHPLNTTDHPDFSLDGNKICVDIRMPDVAKSHIEHFKIQTTTFTFDGIIPNTDNKTGDYYLFFYGAEDNYEMGEFIACFMDDLYDTAQLYIDKFCSMEQYLLTHSEVKHD